jgi:hypothetical protein
MHYRLELSESVCSTFDSHQAAPVTPQAGHGLALRMHYSNVVTSPGPDADLLLTQGEDDGSAIMPVSSYLDDRDSDKPLGVYALYDSDRNLQYVSYSRNIVLAVRVSRAAEHCSDATMLLCCAITRCLLCIMPRCTSCTGYIQMLAAPNPPCHPDPAHHQSAPHSTHTSIICIIPRPPPPASPLQPHPAPINTTLMLCSCRATSPG